jgi:hypothetical protein
LTDKCNCKCKWNIGLGYHPSNIVYETSCDNLNFFEDGDIELNGYKFCPYCGKKIEEVKNDQRE